MTIWCPSKHISKELITWAYVKNITTFLIYYIFLHHKIVLHIPGMLFEFKIYPSYSFAIEIEIWIWYILHNFLFLIKAHYLSHNAVWIDTHSCTYTRHQVNGDVN